MKRIVSCKLGLKLFMEDVPTDKWPGGHMSDRTYAFTLRGASTAPLRCSHVPVELPSFFSLSALCHKMAGSLRMFPLFVRGLWKQSDFGAPLLRLYGAASPTAPPLGGNLVWSSPVTRQLPLQSWNVAASPVDVLAPVFRAAIEAKLLGTCPTKPCHMCSICYPPPKKKLLSAQIFPPKRQSTKSECQNCDAQSVAGARDRIGGSRVVSQVGSVEAGIGHFWSHGAMASLPKFMSFKEDHFSGTYEVWTFLGHPLSK